MIDVVLSQQTATEVINIVHELREQGLVQGEDFEFAYHAADYDNWSGDVSYNINVFLCFIYVIDGLWKIVKILGHIINLYYQKLFLQLHS